MRHGELCADDDDSRAPFREAARRLRAALKAVELLPYGPAGLEQFEDSLNTWADDIEKAPDRIPPSPPPGPPSGKADEGISDNEEDDPEEITDEEWAKHCEREEVPLRARKHWE